MRMTLPEIHMLVEGYIGTTSDGYLCNFTYAKHERFYPVYCDLDVDVVAYRDRGHTTRSAFIEILKDAKPRDKAKIIHGTFEMLPPPEAADDEVTRNKLKIYTKLKAIAVRLESDGLVDTPAIPNTSDIVYEALRDAELLLNSRGPQNAVDRAHTALHGYLKQLCIDRGEKLPADSSLTALFKILRENFPEFKAFVPHDTEAKKLFGSIATAIDCLNTIRNRGTLAHPNELLLDSPEAMLYINLSRAALAYIESKIHKIQ